ncbi:MAG: alanine racemase, partial [Armatimonadetes bacterium]|nr:alanine racemase [Armatimonadota bacterium]
MAELSVGKSIWDPSVPSPLVYVEMEICRRNIEKMASLTKEQGVGLRPHIKTHKLKALGALQLNKGAIGLTVAKPSEALSFRKNGLVTEYLIAQPFLTLAQVNEMVTFSEETPVLFCVDDERVAEVIGDAFAKNGRQAPIILIVDTGYGRMGVPYSRAVEKAAALASLKGVRFVGIRSHAGHIYREESEQGRLKVAREEAERMAEVAAQLRKSGI